MNQRQQNHFKMFLNVQNHLSSNTTKWSSIPRMNDYKSNIDELISLITKKSNEAEIPISVSERKQNLLYALAVKVAGVSGVLQAYALEQKNPDFAASIKLSKSDVILARDAEREALVNKVLVAAKEHLEELAAYGLSKLFVSEAEGTLSDLTALVGKPRSIRSQKFVALQTVSRLIDECNILLNTQLDKVMLLFQYSEEEFYNGYLRARTIVDR